MTAYAKGRAIKSCAGSGRRSIREVTAAFVTLIISKISEFFNAFAKNYERTDFMPQITYTQYGDYLLPDIITRCSTPEDYEPLTKYGNMRRTHLRKHRRIHYDCLLLSGELFPHLHEIQRMAEDRFDTLMAQLVKRNPPPDKASDGLAWAAHMNMLK